MNRTTAIDTPTHRLALARALSLVALTLAAMVAGPLAAEQGSDTNSEDRQVVARVNGEILYSEDVASLLSEIHRDNAVEQRSGFSVDQLMFRLVNDTLLAQEARTLGMAEEGSIQRKLTALRERMAQERIEREEIHDRLVFEQDEIANAYERLFRTATLRLITRKDKGEAEQLRQEVDAGADFETLARERSQDPYSMRGGLVENLSEYDMPDEIASSAFSLSSGEVAGPVPTSLGWTIFRVEHTSPADPDLFEKRRGSVMNRLRFQKADALRTILLARLGETYPVQLHAEVYEAITVKPMADGRLLPNVEDPEAAVVTVGDRQIRADAFGQALAGRWANIANVEVARAIKPILLDRLTVDELLTSEALRRGYERTPEVERAVHALETRLLVRSYLAEVIAPKVEITNEEVRAYYENNRDEFRKPPRLFVSQLTVATREEAEEMLEKLEQGAEFAWLARRYSTDRLRDAGGSVGWVLANRGVTGFQRELATAEAGDVFGPSGSPGDWRLLRVDALEQQGHYEFTEVSGNVRAQVEQRAYLELIDHYIRQLRERSEIWINDEAIAAMEIQGLPEAGDDSTAPGHGGP